MTKTPAFLFENTLELFNTEKFSIEAKLRPTALFMVFFSRGAIEGGPFWGGVILRGSISGNLRGAPVVKNIACFEGGIEEGPFFEGGQLRGGTYKFWCPPPQNQWPPSKKTPCPYLKFFQKKLKNWFFALFLRFFAKFSFFFENVFFSIFFRKIHFFLFSRVFIRFWR